MKIGDVVVVVFDYDTPVINNRGEITKITADFIYINGCNEFVNAIPIHCCWPAMVESELISVLCKRNELKKAYNDSMSLIYQLRNECKRKELKNDES